MLLQLSGPLSLLPSLSDRLQSGFPALSWAVGIVLLTYVGSRLASGRMRGALSRAGLKPNIALLLARVLWVALWAVGLLLALNQFTNGLTPLAALIGVFGLAASLSLQSVLQNLVAGIYLLIERPFNLQDYITVIGPPGVNHEGRVEDIQMRTTHLRNRDNELILVPNFSIFTGVVTNRTVEGGLVQYLTLTFPRRTEVAGVRERMLPMLAALPTVMDAPPPLLRVDTVDKEAWTGSLSLWARTQEGASDAAWAISQTFPDATVNRGGPVA